MFTQDRFIPFRINDEYGERFVEVVGNDCMPDFNETKTSQIPLILACFNREIMGIFEDVVYDVKKHIISIVINKTEFPFLLVRPKSIDDEEELEITAKWIIDVLKRN